MDYTEATISTTTAGSEIVSDLLMRLGAAGTQIMDRADLPDPSKPTANWELMDQSVIDAMPEDVQVKAWFDEDSLARILPSLREQLALLKERGAGLGALSLSLQGVKEEDWAENWKQYYKPFRLGAHMVVKPTWEPWDAQPGDLILEIDPGMAFGSGSHDTTRLCLTFLDQEKPVGLKVLDMGCGSGILSIGALLLGAESVTAVDIDQLATKIAHENAALNGCDDERLKVYCGNILADEALAEKIGEESYDLILANIVADVIIAMAPLFAQYLKKTGTLIVSGIIAERAEEVTGHMEEQGFRICQLREENGWAAAVCRFAE